MLRMIMVLTLLGAPTLGEAAEVEPSWTTFADCAAAYRANAELVDPDRGPTMRQSISELAGDYAAEAMRRLRRQTKASEVAAMRSLRMHLFRRVPEFSRRPRPEVERFIESCPQIEE